MLYDGKRMYWRVLVAMAFAFVIAGCAQNEEQSVTTTSQQQTPIIPTTTQDQASQGSRVEVNIYNTEKANKTLTESVFGLDQVSETQPFEDVSAGGEEGATARRRAVTYSVVANVNVTTGNTIPTATGTATGTGTTTQTPTASPTQSGTQEPRASVQANIPIAAAPGSYSSAQGGVAAGEGSTSGDQSAATTADLKTALVKAGADPTLVDKLMPFLQQLFSLKPVTPELTPSATTKTTE